MTDVSRETITDVAVVDHKPNNQVARPSFFNMEPENQIAYAARIATTLTKVIQDQGLFTNIQGRKYVKVEGWEVLGSFLGVLPRERTVNELPDGSYEAFVDLVRSSDGIVIGGASAICGVDEKRWSSADRYARRSMAITRAVGKAYRTSFSWIISLAGYAPTPAEEMPQAQEETYAEEPEQKKALARHAAEFGVTDKVALQEVSTYMKKHNVPLKALRSEVEAYINMPFKN